jgi:hypothetical protein
VDLQALIAEFSRRGIRLIPNPPKPPVATTKDCLCCTTAIPLVAVRCPHCTSEFSAVA